MFPLDINDYEKIEDRFQMQVNVFGYENKVYPLYISRKSYNERLHLSGKFRRAAHKKYNLKLRIPRKLPIIFHNLQGYDGHIIFKELSNFDVHVAVIPKGIDKYMSIIVDRCITFIDSLQFYNSSLDTLASNLEDNDFKHLTSEFGINKLEILKRKDAYPYEKIFYEKITHLYLNDEKMIKVFFSSLNDEKKYFYSSLRDGKRDISDGHISDEQYHCLQNL